jgi:hypothetical protein
MGIFRKSYCPCGSGNERGFCSHKGATSAGSVTGSGRRTAGGGAGAKSDRKAQSANRAAQPKGKPGRSAR